MSNSHVVRSHAVLGGSSSNRWANCPGSVFYIKDLPPQETSEAALQGTQAHEVAEIVLKNFLEYKLTGVEVPLTSAVTEADDLVVQAAYGYRDAVWEKVLESNITGKAYGLEDSFVLDRNLDMSGYVDFWCVYIDDRGKRVGCIVDFKYGYHYVAVEDNSQLAFYACALREELKKAGKDLDYVRVCIYQPRVPNAEPYRESKYTAKQLDSWRKKFFKAAEQIFVKKKPVFKTGSWCMFCPAQAVCTKYKKELDSKTSLALIEPNILDLPPPEQVSDEQLLKIIKHKPVIERFLSECQAYAIRRMQSTNPIAGYKLVYTKTRRKWKDDAETIIKMLAEKGIDDTYKKSLKSITVIEKQLEKLVGKEEAHQLMAHFTTLTTPSATLVSETDPRPAINGALDLLDTLPSGETDNL